MKPVYIEWCDAMVNNESWLTLDEALEWGKTNNWVVKQMGWIIEENSEYMLITSKLSIQNEDMQQQLGRLYKIPTTWILKRVDLDL